MRAVVSFANTPFYQEKMKRLQESVEAQGIKFIGYTSCEEVGCKPHSEVPYMFKPYAIQKAIDSGITTVLYCDSPIIAIKDISPVFDHIEEFGFMFFDNIGHPLGKWCNDKTLKAFRLTKEKAMDIKMIMACCMGFDFNYLSVELLFKNYKDMAIKYYPGSWDDHRHDQTVMSWLLYIRDYHILTAHETFFMYEHFKEVFTIAPSVCLVSR